MSSDSPIVYGVDTSSEAAAAASVAGRIAALLDRPLALVHAAPKPWVSERPYGDYPVRLEQQAAFERAGYLRTVLAPLEVTEPARVERIVEWSTIPPRGCAATRGRGDRHRLPRPERDGGRARTR
jgi:universal stress protein family protein